MKTREKVVRDRKTVFKKENSRPMFKLKTMPIEPSLDEFTTTARMDSNSKDTKESQTDFPPLDINLYPEIDETTETPGSDFHTI